LIGSLFRAENKARTKTNVMVFLRPVIVRDGRTLADISTNRYDYVRQQTTDQPTDNRIIRDHDVPVLPPLTPSPAQGVPAQDGLFDLNRMTRPAPPPPPPPGGPVGVAPAGPAPGAGNPAGSPGASNTLNAPNVVVGAPMGSAAQHATAAPLIDSFSSATGNFQRTDQP